MIPQPHGRRRERLKQNRNMSSALLELGCARAKEAKGGPRTQGYNPKGTTSCPYLNRGYNPRATTKYLTSTLNSKPFLTYLISTHNLFRPLAREPSFPGRPQGNGPELLEQHAVLPGLRVPRPLHVLQRLASRRIKTQDVAESRHHGFWQGPCGLLWSSETPKVI